MPLRLVFVVLLIAPSLSRACACGCGIFEVGTSSMLPSGAGPMASVDYAFQDQDRNWSGSSRAPSADNPDRDIRTSFLTPGYQDMFSRSWGIRLEVPLERRHFETTGGATGTDPVSLDYGGLGDVRIEGIYTGFSPDMSGGLTFGLKLPTGSFTWNDPYGDVDRDTEIGSGSTDLLLGGFRRFNMGTDYGWSGFVQAQLDVPFLVRDRYRPGAELDAAVGTYYSGWSLGRVRVTPVGQVKLSLRGRDTGAGAAYPAASGFGRVVLAPGIEFDAHPFKGYVDVELPVCQRFTGYQLAAPVMFRMSVSRMF